jgi:uncharacterized pyridoxal phosphate-dependent enzyme
VTRSSILEDLGLRRVINMAGAMTNLGSSTIEPEVTMAMVAASSTWVDMEELGALAGQKVAAATGAEAGYVTGCAAAGIAIAVAACLTRGDPRLVELVPQLPKDVVRRVVLQKAHAVHFGASLTTMLALGGARVSELGAVNRCEASLIASALRQPTGALVYVVSHHTASGDVVGIEPAIELAHSFDVPVIIDAAAEIDLGRFVGLGADLVVYSGHKAISGPTSGLIAGRQELIAACAAQGKGIARMSKVSKEALVGLIVALDRYGSSGSDEALRLERRVGELATLLGGLSGSRLERVFDGSRPIPRLRLTLDRYEAGLDAAELSDRLAKGNPSIRLRSHGASLGYVEFDPRGIADEELVVVADTVHRAVTEATEVRRAK